MIIQVRIRNRMQVKACMRCTNKEVFEAFGVLNRSLHIKAQTPPKMNNQDSQLCPQDRSSGLACAKASSGAARLHR